MATRRLITLDEVEKMLVFKGISLSSASLEDEPKLSIGEIEKRMLDGEVLVVEESGFKDPGPDYTKVFLGAQEILHIEGY